MDRVQAERGCKALAPSGASFEEQIWWYLRRYVIWEWPKPTGKSARDIASHSGRSEGHIRRMLRSMMARGIVRRRGALYLSKGKTWPRKKSPI